MTTAEPVKPPQSRDGQGSSAVFVEPADVWQATGERVFVKRQDAYWCRPAWRLFRRTPTLRRELRGLTACQTLGIDVPHVVSYREAGTHAELVLAEVDGRPLDAALADAGADRAIILRHVAEVIGTLHRAGWTHGALYPDHILVGAAPQYRVTLIDLEKARHTRLRRRTDLDRFWRHHATLSRQDRDVFAVRYRDVLRSTRT